jgi:hypothetical protein
MKPSVANILLAIVVVALGIAIAAGAIYVGDTDDAPGASLAGILLMLGSFVLAVKIARRKQPQ